MNKNELECMARDLLLQLGQEEEDEKGRNEIRMTNKKQHRYNQNENQINGWIDKPSYDFNDYEQHKKAHKEIQVPRRRCLDNSAESKSPTKTFIATQPLTQFSLEQTVMPREVPIKNKKTLPDFLASLKGNKQGVALVIKPQVQLELQIITKPQAQPCKFNQQESIHQRSHKVHRSDHFRKLKVFNRNSFGFSQMTYNHPVQLNVTNSNIFGSSFDNLEYNKHFNMDKIASNSRSFHHNNKQNQCNWDSSKITYQEHMNRYETSSPQKLNSNNIIELASHLQQNTMIPNDQLCLDNPNTQTSLDNNGNIIDETQRKSQQISRQYYENIYQNSLSSRQQSLGVRSKNVRTKSPYQIFLNDNFIPQTAVTPANGTPITTSNGTRTTTANGTRTTTANGIRTGTGIGREYNKVNNKCRNLDKFHNLMQMNMYSNEQNVDNKISLSRKGSQQISKGLIDLKPIHPGLIPSNSSVLLKSDNRCSNLLKQIVSRNNQTKQEISQSDITDRFSAIDNHQSPSNDNHLSHSNDIVVSDSNALSPIKQRDINASYLYKNRKKVYSKTKIYNSVFDSSQNVCQPLFPTSFSAILNSKDLFNSVSHPKQFLPKKRSIPTPFLKQSQLNKYN